MSYTFGKSTFSAGVWVKAGDVFPTPASLEVDMLTPGGFAVEVVRQSGVVAARAERNNPNGGRHVFDFQAGGEFGAGVLTGDYKVRIVNVGQGRREVRAGALSAVGEARAPSPAPNAPVISYRPGEQR